MGLTEISSIKNLENVAKIKTSKVATNIIISRNINQSQGKEDIVATLNVDAIRLYSKVYDYDNKGGHLYLASVMDAKEDFEYYFDNCKNSRHKFYLKNNS